MLKNIFRFASAVFFAVGMSFPALAAGLEDLNVSGTNLLSEGQVAEADAAIKSLPEALIGLFNKTGSRLEFVENGKISDNDNIMGSYFASAGLIQVVNQPAEASISYVLAHEFGHFLYDKTHLYFSDEALASLKELAKGPGTFLGFDMTEVFANYFGRYNMDAYSHCVDEDIVFGEACRVLEWVNDNTP